MSCPSASSVEEFVFGRLASQAQATFEAHLEECAECFLRVATEAAEASRVARTALQSRVVGSARLTDFLTTTLMAETLFDGEEQPTRSAVVQQGQIGPWRVRAVLGAGGMGIVYRVEHESTGREAALKTVKRPPVAAAVS